MKIDLIRWEYKGTEEEAVTTMPFQLQRLFLALQTSDKQAVETTDLTKSFGWDSSDGRLVCNPADMSLLFQL